MIIWRNLKPAILARAIACLAPRLAGRRLRRIATAAVPGDRYAALRRRPPRNAREAADLHLLRSLD